MAWYGPMRRGTRAALAVGVLALLLAVMVLAWRGFGGVPEEDTNAAPTSDAAEARRVYADIPKIDVHVHVPPTLARSAMRIFREHGVQVALNASGAEPGERLALVVAAGRGAGGLLSYCHVDWREFESPDFATYAEETLTACKEQGAIGLKIFKGPRPRIRRRRR